MSTASGRSGRRRTASGSACVTVSSMSWLEPDREMAEAGIRAVVAEIDGNLREEGKPVPEPGVQWPSQTAARPGQADRENRDRRRRAPSARIATSRGRGSRRAPGAGPLCPGPYVLEARSGPGTRHCARWLHSMCSACSGQRSGQNVDMDPQPPDAGLLEGLRVEFGDDGRRAGEFLRTGYGLLHLDGEAFPRAGAAVAYCLREAMTSVLESVAVERPATKPEILHSILEACTSYERAASLPGEDADDALAELLTRIRELEDIPLSSAFTSSG